MAKKVAKIDKSNHLGVGMAAIHTVPTLDKEVLQKSPFEELGYSSVHKYFKSDTKVFIASVVYCVPLAGVAVTKKPHCKCRMQQCVKKCWF